LFADGDKNMTAQEQARLLGMFFWVYTALQVFLTVAMGILFLVFFGAIFSQVPQRPGEPGPEVMFPIMIVVMVIVLGSTLLFAIPEVVAGYGLRNGKPWARVWSIIASCIALMSFPIGTALGVYGLVFLLSEDGRRYFESTEFTQFGTRGNKAFPPPPPNSWQ